ETSYHHVLGADASSSAKHSGWFGKTSGWKITGSTFCCYNAFSREDIRVQVKIPGGVDAYIVTSQGERKEPTDQDWLECGLSATLRAFLYTSDDGYHIAALRRLRPISNLKEEQRFLDYASQLFWKCWKLGSNSETQIATHTNNHLIDALQRYFFDSFRFDDFISFIGGFVEKDQELNYLIAKALIKNDKEVYAARNLHSSIKILPTSHRLLYCQAEFLFKKGEYDAAFEIAQQAVRFAPSEFLPWSMIVEILIAQKKYITALLTLNSAPMFTFSGRELPRMPSAKFLHQPPHSEIMVGYDIGEQLSPLIGAGTPVLTIPSTNIRTTESVKMPIADESITNEKSGLLKLPAKDLKGTFLKAYQLLVQIVAEIGWDDLLRLRSAAFIMEEEYRNSIISMNQSPDEANPNQNLSPYPPKNLHFNTGPSVNAEPENVDVDHHDTISDTQPEATHHDPQIETSANQEPELDAREDHEQEDHEQRNLNSSESITTIDTDLQLNETNNALDQNTEEAPDHSKDETQDIEEIKADEQTDLHEKLNGINKQEDESAFDEDGMSEIPLDDEENPDDNKPEAESQDFGDESSDIKAVPDVSKSKKKKSKKKNKNSNKKVSEISADISDKLENLSLSGNDQNISISDSAENNSTIPQVDGPADYDDYSEDHPTNNDESIGSALSQNPKIDGEEREDNQDSIESMVEEMKQKPKRLCERWLDNLFILLYEDLRVYTLWQSEMHHLKQSDKQILSSHSQLEWEALGDVAFRLNHFEESQLAFTFATEYRFSYYSWIQLLKISEKLEEASLKELKLKEAAEIENTQASGNALLPQTPATPSSIQHIDVSNDSISVLSTPSQENESRVSDEIIQFHVMDLREKLDVLVWLIVYINRWYDESIFPTFVCHFALLLVSKYGLFKIQNILFSMNLKPDLYKLVSGYFKFSEEFKTPGFD
ncbi:hypothetical protein BB560_003911, partial [Smittium megazygosporum]